VKTGERKCKIGTKNPTPFSSLAVQNFEDGKIPVLCKGSPRITGCGTLVPKIGQKRTYPRMRCWTCKLVWLSEPTREGKEIKSKTLRYQESSLKEACRTPKMSAFTKGSKSSGFNYREP